MPLDVTITHQISHITKKKYESSKSLHKTEQQNLCKEILFYYKKKNPHPLYTSLEKAMAPHSSTLAWKIPWTEEPGRLQSLGSLRVGHD